MTVPDLYVQTFATDGFCLSREVHPDVRIWYIHVWTILRHCGVLEGRSGRWTRQFPFHLGGAFHPRRIVQKLRCLEIQDAETGRKLNFYRMGLDERRCFLEQMLEDEARGLTGKIRQVPGLAEQIRAENRVIRQLMRMSGMSCAADVPETAGDFMKYQMHSFDIYNTCPHTPISSVKESWKGSARRGDLLIALPKHGSPWIYSNLNPRVTHKMGHVAILTQDIDSATDIYSKCTVECCIRKGVHERAMRNWDTPHYVVGIRRVKWIWKWNGGQGLLKKEILPAGTVSRLADQAEKLVGKRYVRWYEVVTCKWVAPVRFTCSTLAWWCARKAYGFTISNWLFTFTTPSDILRNPATFIKAEIK